MNNVTDLERNIERMEFFLQIRPQLTKDNVTLQSLVDTKGIQNMRDQYEYVCKHATECSLSINQLCTYANRIEIVCKKAADVLSYTKEMPNTMRCLAIDIQSAYRTVNASYTQSLEFQNFDLKTQWFIAKDTPSISSIQRIIGDWENLKNRGKLSIMIEIGMFDKLHKAVQENPRCLAEILELRTQYVRLCLDSAYHFYSKKQTTADPQSPEIYNARFRCFIRMCRAFIKNTCDQDVVQTWSQNHQEAHAESFIRDLRTKTLDQFPLPQT